LRWLADENFNNDILRGLRRRIPTVEILRAQDVGLTGVRDELLLGWAATEERVLLTHDVSTITEHAYRRILNGDRMPGVFAVGRTVSTRIAIDDLTLLTQCSLPREWEGQVRYLPLR
jgi:hypothetical protein